MTTKRNRKQTRLAGFSMIEMLVASTILVVIVMMLAMLFQQTSLAWRTGVRRAKSFMEVRSALGAIQRDAAAAIDARYIPLELRNKFPGKDQVFNGSSLKFFTLTGTGFAEKDATLPLRALDATLPLRALSYITYDTSGNREETVLCADGSLDTPKKSNVLIIETDKDKDTATFNNFVAKDPPAMVGEPVGTRLPLFVTVTVDVKKSGKSYDIGAASSGPDGTFGNPPGNRSDRHGRDDIVTWADQ